MDWAVTLVTALYAALEYVSISNFFLEQSKEIRNISLKYFSEIYIPRAHIMADVAPATTGGYQPTAEELVQAAKDAKAQNPDFGVKRIWTLLKEKGWVVSEQRVKKVMQENGLSENSSANSNGVTNGNDKDKNSVSAPAPVSFASRSLALALIMFSRTARILRKRKRKGKQVFLGLGRYCLSPTCVELCYVII